MEVERGWLPYAALIIPAMEPTHQKDSPGSVRDVVSEPTTRAEHPTLSTASVARILHVDESDVLRMIRRGELRHTQGRYELDPDGVVDRVKELVRAGQLGSDAFLELAAAVAAGLD